MEAPASENRVTPVVLSELGPGSDLGPGREIDSLGTVDVEVAVGAGRAVISFNRLINLEPGEVLALDRTPDAPVDIRVNGTLVARGDVVIVDEEVATRISEIT
jgi:flagellar motor switch protein FliN/FliY